MSNVAVINMFGLTPLAQMEIIDGMNAIERSIAWARELPDVTEVVALTDGKTPVPDGMAVRKEDSWDESVLLRNLDAAGKGFENIFYAWGDAPMLDKSLSVKLYDLHYRYFAEYTFADGYPVGTTPEIMAAGVPARLIPLAGGSTNPVVRDSIFEILRKDINAFDVETDISRVDLRMDRVSLTCDSRRNVSIMKKLREAGGVDAETLQDVIPAHRGLLRDLPAYFPIQITDRCPQACSYCPFPLHAGDVRNNRGFMEAEKFSALCRRIVEFAGDAVISPSLWGEPSLHPEIHQLIAAALDAGETRVLIETSGIGWDDALLTSLASTAVPGRLEWIVSLDAADKDLYASLRGNGQEEAEGTARRLQALYGDSVWVQAVRMNENEEHLEDFHKKWTAEGFEVIIQKYDSGAGFLPERQPADLSPLNRFPCWHLKRDFPVLLNGDVPMCREVLGREEPLGNVFSDSLEEIWAAGRRFHDQHVESRYPGVCETCDEYYTFNF